MSKVLLRWFVVPVSKQLQVVNEYTVLELSGSGSSLTIRHLKDLTRGYNPDIICLTETKNGSAFCERIREQIGMNKVHYIEPRGRSRGLALWWTDEIDIKILGDS